MFPERHVKLFKNGRNQAVRIPREFELPGEDELDRASGKLAGGNIRPDRELDLPWKRSLFLRDPDGIVSEWFVQRPSSRNLADVRADVFAYSV